MKNINVLDRTWYDLVDPGGPGGPVDPFDPVDELQIEVFPGALLKSP